MRQLIAIGLSAALFIPLVHEAAAEKRGAPVPPGSTRKEVIALRGEPKERIEAETKRTETWIYPGDEIVFRGDKVIDIRVSPPEPEAEPLAEVSGESVSIKGPGRHPVTARAPAAKQVDVSALLAEVSKASSDEPGGESPGRMRPGGGE